MTAGRVQHKANMTPGAARIVRRIAAAEGRTITDVLDEGAVLLALSRGHERAACGVVRIAAAIAVALALGGEIGSRPAEGTEARQWYMRDPDGESVELGAALRSEVYYELRTAWGVGPTPTAGAAPELN